MGTTCPGRLRVSEAKLAHTVSASFWGRAQEIVLVLPYERKVKRGILRKQEKKGSLRQGGERTCLLSLSLMKPALILNRKVPEHSRTNLLSHHLKAS